MTAILAPAIVFKDWDGNGQPLAFGTVGTYQAGTLVPQATYVDSTQTTPNTNPITLNNRGEANIWLNPLLNYKFIVLDSAGRQIRVVDQIQGSLTYTQLIAILTQSFIGSILYPRTAAEIAAGITPVNIAIPSHLTGFVLPERYGAVGNGNAGDATNGALDTTAIGNAVTIASATSAPIWLSRKYIAVPATVTTQEGGPITVAWVMQSNLHIAGERGTSITLANNQSTDSAVVNLALFHTNSALSNVSSRGVIYDLNGANNKISPSRPATYNNSYNMAAISVSGTPGGVAARIDDCTLEDNTFQNCPGVCFVVCAQSNSTGVTLGKRWTVKNNLFLNGGTDTDDHTSLYGWVDFATVEGNTFWEDNPPHTVGKTGGVTGYEIHGQSHKVQHNTIYNYANGVRWCTNLSTADPTLRTIIAHNNFISPFNGITIERQTSGLPTLGIGEIDENIFYMDDYTFSGAQAQKNCITIDSNYSLADIKITNNIAWKTGATIPGVFVFADTIGVAAQIYDRLRIHGNSIYGLAIGIYAQATTTSAGIGTLDITNNEFLNLAPDASVFTTSTGISISASAGIGTLILDGNRFIDDRGVPLFNKGIVINSGTVTDLFVGKNTYKGLTSNPYSEGGGITITNRKGSWLTTGVTSAIATATTVTHGLLTTPTGVTLTAMDGTPTAVFPSALGSTTFTINYTGGGTHAFSWTAFFGNQQ